MIIQADALHIPIASGTVQTVVTSPPYWGLRDYRTAKWKGGDAGCDHLAPKAGGTGPASAVQVNVKRIDFESGGQFRNVCRKCGARRIDAQLGLESTPEEFVANMVAVFREVRRVLKSHGTLWLNLGDSFFGGNKGNSGPLRPGDKQATNIGSWDTSRRDTGTLSPTRSGGYDGLKVKDLCGIPWRVAFALQADGWWLRSDIIYSKTNCMPESVKDRPTRSHEYLFLLAKSGTYFYDADAIKEPAGGWNGSRFEDGKNLVTHPNVGKVRSPAGWKTGKGSHGSIHADGREQEVQYTEINGETRNKRSVWTIATQPYSGAHFATFPEKLVETCIRAGSKPGDIVFDPFVGSGTVIRVATRLQRRGVGCDLNFGYLSKQADKRMRDVQVEMQYHSGDAATAEAV